MTIYMTPIHCFHGADGRSESRAVHVD